MKRKYINASMVSAGLLTFAAVALAQTPPQTPPQQPPDSPPRQPSPPNTTQQPPKSPPREAPPRAADYHNGYMATPRYAQALSGTLAENSIQISNDSDFKGKQTTLADIQKAHQAGTLNEYPADFNDSATSLKWSLAPGILVVLFDDAAGKGEQLALWGKGQIPDLAKCNFNDEATRWTWYDIGGGSEMRSAGSMLMPQGAQALAGNIQPASVQLYDDQDFKDEAAQTITLLASKPAGDWQELPGKPNITSGEKENAASSIRFDIPEGVIVMLSAKDDGNNDIVLFGKGQYSDLATCDFNNRASRWSWAYIGTPMIKDKQPDMP